MLIRARLQDPAPPLCGGVGEGVGDGVGEGVGEDVGPVVAAELQGEVESMLCVTNLARVTCVRARGACVKCWP